MAAHFEQAKAAFLDGLNCQQAGLLDEAEAHYLESLRLLPGRASTLINLAATQLAARRPADALVTADDALAAEPGSSEAWLHRSTALARLGRLDEALTGFDRLLSLSTEHAPEQALAWSSKAGVLRELQRHAESAEAYRRALQLGDDPELGELNRYFLAAVEAGTAPPSPPAVYVQQLFDGYADDFDRHLVDELKYDGHRRLIKELAALDAGPYQSTLDLGCGTGLCGPLLRPMTDRLTGIDLSAGMLAKAGASGVYDRLEQTDVVDFLRDDEGSYDLLVACDVFIYVGALDALFDAASRRMTHGIFCFSVELMEASVTGDPRPYRLETSLRYSHGRAYLMRLAEQHGFEPIVLQSAPVRSDQGRPVVGLYVYLRRRPA